MKLMFSGKSAVLKRLKSVTLQRVIMMAVAVVGVGIAVYPPAASWLTDRAQQSQIDAYAKHIESASSDELDGLLKKARDYNESLPNGPLQDPFSASGETPELATRDYLKQMKVVDTDVMAELNVPSAKINLPIYHGTGASSLDRGVGHLFGSSLPVGGEGTHSVLTGHSGLPNGAMFTSLHGVKKGDTFTISALGETIYYRVDQIKVVLPDDTTHLALEKNKDLVTLITCTPVNVNTHRLLIRGERIPAPTKKSELVSAATKAEFPWWIFPPIVVLGGISAILFWPNKKVRQQRRVAPSV
ncbi:class C sortase [Leucobacter coleopterorum]|uniref:Class C sortase n=1 Tax=Leucobacter coleopterorum TaxID=2714933 RepID=A0ABX6K247_9MICO|nr:class C sortase [Leucobacter coleopterorum]QIM19200.1 class C sortase [Leucobacter coleopterorum]